MLPIRLPLAAATRSATAPKIMAASFRSMRRGYSSVPPQARKQGMSVWPFVGLVVVGTGTYVALVNQRKELAEQQQIKMAEQRAAAHEAAVNAPSVTGAVFDPSKVTVFFVLGGPGAGKGTQCARLVKEYGFTHLSAGDLLRAEQERPGSEYGQLIKDYIRDGKIVPMEVTIKLLENAMSEAMGSGKDADVKGRFLIDGFPRKMDQAVKFEESICPAKLVLFFECPEKELERRLLERGKTSGRSDDNIESIRKRFRTFIETSMPVVNSFAKEGRVVRIDSSPPVDEVYKITIAELTKKVGKF